MKRSIALLVSSAVCAVASVSAYAARSSDSIAVRKANRTTNAEYCVSGENKISSGKDIEVNEEKKEGCAQGFQGRAREDLPKTGSTVEKNPQH